MEQTSEIDDSKLDEIRQIQPPGEDLVATIIGLFIKESTRLQNGMEYALGNADCDAVRQIAHSLQSCSANVGATHVTRLSQQLESAGRDGEMGTVTLLLEKLKLKLGSAIAELQDLNAA